MLKIGIKNSLTATVAPNMTAKRITSGALEVFATPWMIAFMESCCMDCAENELEDDQTTVGIRVDVSHLATTPVGMEVTVSCELIEIDRRRLVFHVEAYNELEKIGEGTHQRFIVNGKKIEADCAAKANR